MIGLWMADLYASGWVRKLQDHWKPTVAVEVCAMALALAFMAGGEKVATPADKAVGSIQVYAGKFSYDPSYVWPQYMLMSNWSVVISFALAPARCSSSAANQTGSRPR